MIDRPIRVSFQYWDQDHCSWEMLSRDFWTPEEFDSFVVDHCAAKIALDVEHYRSLPWAEKIVYAITRINDANAARLMALHESRSQTLQ